MSQCGFLVQITLFHIRGYAANSGLDALFYKTKLSRRNCSIFLYVLGILVDYTGTTFQNPSSAELR
jgi:hypothetical protein